MERWSGSRFADVRYAAETGSTNADLLEAARGGTTGPLVLVTGHQKAGRGRQDRTWFDEPGDSLLVSVLVTAERAWADLVPLAAGLAAERAVNGYVISSAADTGRVPPHDTAALKWPNDVLVPALDERKLAGILVESTNGASPGTLAVVIGMGLNLRWSSEPPAEVRLRATTLTAAARAVAGITLPDDVRSHLLGEYLIALDAALETLAGPDGRAHTVARYRRRCLTVGRSLELTTSSEAITGRAVGIGDGGELRVELADGTVRSVTAGDAHHRPPG
ncbi:MAG: biotin--[acetyl-CoA-carboxylase] ligase [Acidimicrobiia bacterium]|nr:biotin--[acetyl-CoA-carboxylase] ligase [Acidimicrobiia bacterium]